MADARRNLLSLQRHYSRAAQHTLQPAGGLIGDSADSASGEVNLQENIPSLEGNDAILDRIAEALERIRDGVYGLCQGCGKKIPTPRLQAIPYATECIGCATERERGSPREPVDAKSFARVAAHEEEEELDE